MRFDTFQFTDKGKREPNEDSVGAFFNENFSAWIAADGLGGHINGELASAEAVAALEEQMRSCFSIDRSFVESAMRFIHRRIKMLGGPLTTAVAAFSDEEKLFYSNCGDSRFIFIRNGKVLTRSNDHSVAYALYQRGDIPYEEIPNNPYQNRLLHAMGVAEDFFGESYEPITLEPDDAFILCTDGFWELITERDVLRTLKVSPTAETWAELMLDLLKERMTETSDNYSLITVQVK